MRRPARRPGLDRRYGAESDPDPTFTLGRSTWRSAGGSDSDSSKFEEYRDVPNGVVIPSSAC